ncbi:hypothetical protein H0Z60_18505 [Ectothiorhodospiraceae bacterium WFHF3C12]|nr:hypothetical protein [Ectothiorhodospiraceae bacterium WFHF3C12]
MAGNLYSPLSGDVSQAINPWTWFARIAGSQMGFINIHQTSGGDTELEREIVEDIASYGRQLGRISEALAVLAEHTDREKLSPDERQALEAFETMAQRIEEAKARRREAASPLSAIDDVLAALQELRERDSERYRREVARIRQALDLDGAEGAVTPLRGQGGAE